MVKLLHTADLHLDSPFSGLTPEEALRRRRLQRQIPMALAERCRAEGCGLWLAAGDVFDGGRLAPETVEALQAAWEHCAVPVLVAPGNHDPYTSDSPWARVKWPGNVHVFSGPWEAVELESLGCRIWGAAFQGREARGLLGAAAAERGFWEIGVLHGEVDGKGRYGPLPREEIAASGLTYLALGHVHACSGLQWAGRTAWAYPGCPEGRGFDELGEKGCLWVTIGDEGQVEAEFVPLARRRYRVVEVDLTGAETPEAALAAALPADAREDILRFVFTGESGLEGIDLAPLEALAAGCCWSAQVRDRTRVRRDLWDRAEEDTLTGLFLRTMRARLSAAGPEERETLELAVRFGLAALEHGEDCRP